MLGSSRHQLAPISGGPVRDGRRISHAGARAAYLRSSGPPGGSQSRGAAGGLAGRGEGKGLRPPTPDPGPDLSDEPAAAHFCEGIPCKLIWVQSLLLPLLPLLPPHGCIAPFHLVSVVIQPGLAAGLQRPTYAYT